MKQARMLLLPHYIFPILMLFNGVIIGDGVARFFRVLSYAKTI